MEFIKQRQLSFEEKQKSLEWSFAVWEAHAGEGQPFRKHQRQLRAIFAVLRQMSADVATLAGGQNLSGLQNAERGLLAVHRIWEFFRGKLAQRRDPLLGRYLDFADELAWACYRRVQEKAFPDPADPRLKEAPLIFLNGGMSPFALPRVERFSAEEVPGEPLDRSWQKVTRALPVPVIGIPWYQTDRIFDSLVIAHEVGHIVERDFQLEDRVTSLLKAAVDPTRLAAWTAWQSEVFADIFGCVCAGPAFVTNLLETIAVDANVVQTDIQLDGTWGTYPTLFLRALVNMAALEQLGFPQQAAELEAGWRTLYQTHEMKTFEPDIPAVVRALLDGPYPELNGRLRDMVPTTKIAAAAGKDLALLDADRSPQSTDFLTLFTAARLAYEENPSAFGAAARSQLPDSANGVRWKPDSWPAFLEMQMSSSIDPSVRAGEAQLTPPQEAARHSARQQLGAALLAELVPALAP